MSTLSVKDWTALIMAVALGTTSVISAVGVIALPMHGHDIPPSLAALSGACAGYLATYLGVLVGRQNGTTPQPRNQ